MGAPREYLMDGAHLREILDIAVPDFKRMPVVNESIITPQRDIFVHSKIR